MNAVLTPPAGKLPLRRTSSGWYVLEIRGARDIPGYDPREVGRGMSQQTYAREVLGDWTASAGKVVFPEYGDIHESMGLLPYDATRPLLCGWDLPAATGGTPAFVATQQTGTGQWLIFGGVQPREEETVGVWEFAERVAYYLTEQFCVPAGIDLNKLEMVHYGDPAGQQRALGGKGSIATELQSAYDIIRDGETLEVRPGEYVHREGWGWDIIPGEVSLRARLEGVRTRLSMNIMGAPALLVDPGATLIREGFRGGYHYHQRADGRYELDPMKNKYSHSFDALGYVASRAFVLNTGERRLNAALARSRGGGGAIRSPRARGR